MTDSTPAVSLASAPDEADAPGPAAPNEADAPGLAAMDEPDGLPQKCLLVHEPSASARRKQRKKASAPTTAEAALDIVRGLVKEEKFESALKACRQASALASPGSEEMRASRLNEALCCLRLGLNAKCVAACEDVLKQWP